MLQLATRAVAWTIGAINRRSTWLPLTITATESNRLTIAADCNSLIYCIAATVGVILLPNHANHQSSIIDIVMNDWGNYLSTWKLNNLTFKKPPFWTHHLKKNDFFWILTKKLIIMTNNWLLYNNLLTKIDKFGWKLTFF